VHRGPGDAIVNRSAARGGDSGRHVLRACVYLLGKLQKEAWFFSLLIGRDKISR